MLIYYIIAMKNKKPTENRNRGSVMSAYLDARSFWAVMDAARDTGDAPSAIISRAVREYLKLTPKDSGKVNREREIGE